MRHFLVIFFLLVSWLVPSLNGQDFARKQAEAGFVENAPQIDGSLNEDVWNSVVPGSGLVQFRPEVGEAMTEETEFRILYDRHTVFVGVRCFDSNPEGIVARRTGRDQNYGEDDYIFFIFDTFRDRRGAYAFAVNPLGAQWDALIDQNTTRDTNWDGVWHAKCSIDERGWTAEIAIPLSTIDFDPAISNWGFNIERAIRRKAEAGRWSRPDPDFSTNHPSEAGNLVGFDGIQPELNFEFRPYVVGKAHHFNGEDDFDFDVGFDLRYRWSPSLSSTLSINTDFAETAIDSPQINFTRFPLLFPEKREFFLEDNAFYTFAQPWESMIRPFYSRTIGLSQTREVVPILGALKVAGRSGPLQIGFTGAYLDDFNQVNSKAVYAARVSRNIGEESRIGIIATYGDPHSNGDNFMGGVDYQYRTTEFFGDKNFTLDAFALNTQTDPVSSESFSDEAYGLSLKYPNEPFSGKFDFVELGERIDPGMGFIRRKGVRRYTSRFDYLYRPDDVSKITTYSIAYSNSLITDLKDNTESYGHSLYPINITFPSEAYLSIGSNYYYDSFDFDWYIGPDFLVPAGEFENTDIALEISSPPSGTVSGAVSLSYGDYYGYSRTYVSPYLVIHTSPFIELLFYYEYSSIESSSSSFDTHVTSNSITFKFSTNLNWRNTVHYDNVSEQIGWNSRLNWEFQPGSNLYIVLNQSYEAMDNSIRILRSQLATKCGLNIRF